MPLQWARKNHKEWFLPDIWHYGNTGVWDIGALGSVPDSVSLILLVYLTCLWTPQSVLCSSGSCSSIPSFYCMAFYQRLIQLISMNYYYYFFFFEEEECHGGQGHEEKNRGKGGWPSICSKLLIPQFFTGSQSISFIFSTFSRTNIRFHSTLLCVWRKSWKREIQEGQGFQSCLYCHRSQ